MEKARKKRGVCPRSISTWGGFRSRNGKDVAIGLAGSRRGRC
jgi:hypothetical protein